MGIEKMTFIDIDGDINCLDDVLVDCMLSGVFHPEHAVRLSEYSIGVTAHLRNPYGALAVKLGEIASQLGISVRQVDDSTLDIPVQDKGTFIEDAHSYLNEMRKEYPGYFQKQNKIRAEIQSYHDALDMLSHLGSPDIDFDRLWRNRFLKIRFGRIPKLNLEHLTSLEDMPCELFKLDEGQVYTWCLYVTTDEARIEIDKLFASLGFERMHVPGFVHGTAENAISLIEQSLAAEREHLQDSIEEIDGYIAREKDKFLMIYTRVKLLHDAYDLRKYVVTIRERFHLVGFVRKSDQKEFTKLFDALPDLTLTAEPAGADPRIPVPVKLRNNGFVRPFEMFVTMYGHPSYGDIDPSPFVAYTYSVLFGVMFGDLGHGLCAILIGLYLWHKKKMDIGLILSRVGVFAMISGFCYGSVFGFEHLLDPVFHMMGFHEKPIEIMSPGLTNTILLMAIGLGSVLILLSIIFNMAVGLKRRDYELLLLSSNGACGFVFYLATLVAVVLLLVFNIAVPPIYTVLFLALPLLFIFFREPIAHYAHFVTNDAAIHHDKSLAENSFFAQHQTNIHAMFESPFVAARFGRVPADSYPKLKFYADEPFMLYPIKTDTEYIWLVYATSIPNKAQIDAIFLDLYFERIYIPEENLITSQETEAFIRKCIDDGGSPEDIVPDEKHVSAKIRRRRTLYERLFPDGLGAFFTETFFEMFEVMLSFITNTMSFLRVGGFILVHAGMMSVVFTLAEMSGGVGSAIIIIIGNIFVMGLEGLIVSIQALRLEFYEMFSRFYDADGEPFNPVTVAYTESAKS